MKETVVGFGAGEQLMGILSMPDRPRPGAMPVLIPNTGLEHRVGPNRLHVHLCRALADEGFPALRLDMSGMGDSGAPAGAGANATSDLMAAMDALQARGLGTRFLVVGLCSGAHDAHWALRADQRIVGAAFIDGYVYPTARYAMTYIAQRAFDPARILRRIFVATRPDDDHDRPEGANEDLDYFRQPTLPEVRRDLADFMRRGLCLCFIYTGQIQNRYNYAGQLEDAVPELRGYPRARVSYLQMADHTFSQTSMRSDLVDVVLDWARQSATVHGESCNGQTSPTSG